MEKINLSKRRKAIKNKRTKKITHSPQNRFLHKITKTKLFLFIMIIGYIVEVYYDPIKDILKFFSTNENIVVSLGDHEQTKQIIPLNTSTTTYIFYTSQNHSLKDKHFLPIGITVYNKSNKSDKSILVSFKYNKINRPYQYEKLLVQKHYGGRSRSDIIHETNSNEEFITSNYKINYLPPYGQQSLIDLGLTSTLDDIQNKVIFLTKKGLDTMITTYSEIDKEKRYSLHYRGVFSSSKKSLDGWVKVFYATYIAKKERRDNNFFQYLYKLISAKQVAIYGLNLDFKLFDTKENIYISKKEIEGYRRYIITPYTWELLFEDQSGLPARTVKFIHNNITKLW
jgi:hypothetical protein